MLFQSATLENTEIIFCRQSPSRLLVWYVCNRTLVTTVLQCVYHVMESLYCSCYKSYIWKSKKKKITTVHLASHFCQRHGALCFCSMQGRICSRTKILSFYGDWSFHLTPKTGPVITCLWLVIFIEQKKGKFHPWSSQEENKLVCQLWGNADAG